MELQSTMEKDQYKLEDLINIPRLQVLMESFYAATDIPCGILDLDGNILVAVGWKDICTKFHRVNPLTEKRCRESDTVCAIKLYQTKKNKYVEYKCRNGLFDVAFPIIVEDNYLANLFIGQFLYEEPDREFFQKQAEDVGFDVDSYMGALDKVPILTRKKVDSIMDYYDKFSAMLTDMGLESLKRKRAEEALQLHAEELANAYEELKSLDKMKDEFLSNVGHELKTPMVSIIGYNELLNEENLGPLNAEQKKATEVVARSSEKLRTLIDSILYLSISNAGKINYVFNPIQISDLIDNVVSDMYPQIKEKRILIKKSVTGNIPLLNGDENYLAQLLVNLIDNAIKFTPSSGSITIAADSKEDKLHISVEDTGIGIPENLIPNLFQRFYQIDASTTRRYSGTGLGLYICKNIVEAHKGEIWVESEEGNGTKFHITLPFNGK